ELRAQRVLGPLLTLAAEHDLDHAAGVAQIDEDHAAVVAPARDPARQRHALARLDRPQGARLVGTDHRLGQPPVTVPAGLARDGHPARWERRPARRARGAARPGTGCWPVRCRWSAPARA